MHLFFFQDYSKILLLSPLADLQNVLPQITTEAQRTATAAWVQDLGTPEPLHLTYQSAATVSLSPEPWFGPITKTNKHTDSSQKLAETEA